MNPNIDDFIKHLSHYNIHLSKAQMDQFELYSSELIDWNEKINLTSITSLQDVYTKHFFDSLSISFFHNIKDVITLIDVGAGAGFPSIPLKILFPHLQITIVDSLNKRIQFLKSLSSKLDIHDVQLIHGRAEDIGRLKEHREQYDIATARAVAKLNVLVEVCIPFVKKGGYFIAMKGSTLQDEVDEASYAIKELKSSIKKMEAFHLPDQESSSRHLVFIQKEKITPKQYPRKTGIPFKSPLQLKS